MPPGRGTPSRAGESALLLDTTTVTRAGEPTPPDSEGPRRAGELELPGTGVLRCNGELTRLGSRALRRAGELTPANGVLVAMTLGLVKSDLNDTDTLASRSAGRAASDGVLEERPAKLNLDVFPRLRAGLRLSVLCGTLRCVLRGVKDEQESLGLTRDAVARREPRFRGELLCGRFDVALLRRLDVCKCVLLMLLSLETRL